MSSELVTQLDNGILTLTLNRPEALNGLTISLMRQLNDSLRDAAASPEVRAVVLTGAGRAFCAGGDMKTFNTGDAAKPAAEANPDAAPRDDLDSAADRVRGHGEGSLLLHQMPKPTIAMIRGACAGAAVALACACDFRIVSETAFFTTAFARIGVSGELGASYYLPRLVGVAKARELFFFADRVPAEEALKIGLVNQVVPDVDLEAETQAFARRLADGPPLAYRFIKANLNAAEVSSPRDVIALEAMHQIRSMRSEDARAAIMAFMEKRTATFTGR